MKARIVLQSIAAAVAVMAAGAASATPVYPDFTFNPAALGGNSLAAFTANDISFSYSEILVFGANNTFTVSLGFQATQFVLDDTSQSPVQHNLPSGVTGLGSSYALNGIFNGSGTFTQDLTNPLDPITTFTLTPGGALAVDYASDFNAGFTVNAAHQFQFDAGSGTLTALANGTALTGQGFGDQAGNLTGSFGQTSTFGLTAAGSTFFTSPVPFYPLSLQSGQFEGVQVQSPGGFTTVTGSGNANFAPVPEPADLALVGIALLGLGFAAKRRSQR